MKYLFVHQYFYPDYSAVSQVISQVAFAVAATGDEVSVICSRNRYDGKARESLPSEEWVNGVMVHRCWGPNFGRRSFVGRILDLASFCLLASWKIIFAPRVDSVLFLTNPPFLAILGAWLKKIRKERFVYVLMDVYPDVAVQGGIIGNGKRIARVLGRLATFTVKNADAVVVLGDDMKEAVVRQGASPDRVHIIRNWADPDKIFPVPPEKNRLRREWGLEGKFVVTYSGNFGVSHDFDDLLHVAGELASDDRIRFLFIGDGIRRPQVEKFVSSRKLRNVIFRPYQDASILPESLSAGDVHYISLREGFEGLVVPSKAYGVMASGRPIVYQGMEAGEIAQTVLKEGIGFVVPPGDREGLKQRILELQANPDLRRSRGEAARRALEERYSASIGLDLYRKVLAEET